MVTWCATWHSFDSTLVNVLACYLTAPGHYLVTYCPLPMNYKIRETLQFPGRSALNLACMAVWTMDNCPRILSGIGQGITCCEMLIKIEEDSVKKHGRWWGPFCSGSIILSCLFHLIVVDVNLNRWLRTEASDLENLNSYDHHWFTFWLGVNVFSQQAIIRTIVGQYLCRRMTLLGDN